MNKYVKKNTTLDNKHTEMLEKFKNDETVLIPKYNSEIKKLENSLNNFKKKIAKSRILILRYIK